MKYGLEPTTFIDSKARLDGVFYKTVKYLGGSGSFGALLVSTFKDYGRRLENLSKIAYIVGLLVILNIFLVSPETAYEPMMEMTPLIFSVFVVYVVSEVTLRGKEASSSTRKRLSVLEGLSRQGCCKVGS